MAETEIGRAVKRTPKGIRGASLGRDPARPIGQLVLDFRPAGELAHVEDAIYEDVSSLATAGRTLFCACDETATVERLVLEEGGGRFSNHESLALGEIFDLPDGPMGEMDIEGIAISDGYLWITGSHSLKRDKLGANDADLKALCGIDWDENRGFLGRVPLRERSPGEFEPLGRDATGDRRRPACLKWDKKGHTALRGILGRDKLLKPFMGVPSKENGFDIEGLAVRGERVFLGLRGPVVGSQAFVVELRLKATRKGRLKPQPFEDGERYRLHALDLGGLGIRDMALCGDRLLILAGATMNFEGPQAIYVLDALPEDGGPPGRSRARHAFDIPVIPGCDHAEGIAPATIGGREALIVVYDSPAPERIDEREHTLKADLFAMP
jgi:hypothetical protein